MLLIMLTVLWGWWKNRWAAGVQGSIPEQVRNYKEVWKGTSSSPIWGLLWASVTVTSETSLRELGSRSLRAHLKDSCPLIEEEKLKIKTTIPQTSRTLPARKWGEGRNKRLLDGFYCLPSTMKSPKNAASVSGTPYSVGVQTKPKFQQFIATKPLKWRAATSSLALFHLSRLAMQESTYSMMRPYQKQNPTLVACLES